MNRTFALAGVLTTLAVPVLASPATAATGCKSTSKAYYGLKASRTGCSTARAVQKSWGTESEFSATDQLNRRWRCKFTLAVSGPTLVACRNAKRLVTFKMRDTQ